MTTYTIHAASSVTDLVALAPAVAVHHFDVTVEGNTMTAVSNAQTVNDDLVNLQTLLNKNTTGLVTYSSTPSLIGDPIL